MPRFEIRQCPACRLRYPQPEAVAQTACPACGGPAAVVVPPFEPPTVPARPRPPNGLLVAALLDNIRSAWNVGSMFRTADAAGLRHLYLCGITATPENPKVAKTALAAETSVGWSHHNDALALAARLKAEGCRLWGLETHPEADNLFEVCCQPGARVVLVVGNEQSGVDPALLGVCDRLVAIPMQGVKESLNAAVAFGVAVFELGVRSPGG